LRGFFYAGVICEILGLQWRGVWEMAWLRGLWGFITPS
jgi:hypothetical protein